MNITDFNAIPNTSSLSTLAIQTAINTCHASGGGIVVIPAGRFITGTLELLDNVTLHLEAGAILEASSCPDDYRKAYPSVPKTLLEHTFDSPFNMDCNLIFARHKSHVGITGKGKIQANGAYFYQTDTFRNTTKYKPNFSEYNLKEWRPGPTIAFMDCENVFLSDFSLFDNPMFGVAIMHCHSVQITSLAISTNQFFINGDGIHIKSSTDISIKDCDIQSEDDALCFYNDNWSWHSERDASEDCRHIRIENCRLSSACTGIRIGYMGSTSIQDIIIENTVIEKASIAFDFICCGGISEFGPVAIEYTGARIEDIHIHNCHAQNALIGVRMNVRDTGANAGIRHVTFSNTTIESVYEGAVICGDTTGKIDTICFKNSAITACGNITPRKVNIFQFPMPLFAETTSFPYVFTYKNANISLESTVVSTAESAIGWEGTINHLD